MKGQTVNGLGNLPLSANSVYIVQRGLVQRDDFAAINEVYATFFNGAFPSRSCVEVARLPKDVMLEIEAIAMK